MMWELWDPTRYPSRTNDVWVLGILQHTNSDVDCLGICKTQVGHPWCKCFWESEEKEKKREAKQKREKRDTYDASVSKICKITKWTPTMHKFSNPARQQTGHPSCESVHRFAHLWRAPQSAAVCSCCEGWRWVDARTSPLLWHPLSRPAAWTCPVKQNGTKLQSAFQVHACMRCYCFGGQTKNNNQLLLAFWCSFCTRKVCHRMDTVMVKPSNHEMAGNVVRCAPQNC